MNVLVAGAGGGKTSSMAKLVISRMKEINNDKVIYVITYTNSAKDKIKDKVIENEGSIPSQIKIDTIHSFLLKEIIYPYNHLIYDVFYKSASQIPLHTNFGYRGKKIKELKNNNIIHVEEVTKISKYLLCGKSKDTKKIKLKRENALKMLSRYLDSVYVDEAQDMDKEFLDVLSKLSEYGIKVNLIGDPKQDLRNRGVLRELILGNPSVKYKTENYRCPKKHVDFSNSFIAKSEHQNYVNNEGCLQYRLESKSDIQSDIDSKKYDLTYIYQKNNRFMTKKENISKIERYLAYELNTIVSKSTSIKDKSIAQMTYVLKKKIINSINRGFDTYKIFLGLEKELAIHLNRVDKGRVGSAIDGYKHASNSESGILVDSIDSIKGLDGYNCLFIVSTQLAPYLFKEAVEQNKMMNYLYVGITRSKRNLTIMVTSEVEKKYGYEFIRERFRELDITEVEA